MRLNAYLTECDDFTYEQYVSYLDTCVLNETVAMVIPSMFGELRRVIQDIVDDFKVDVRDIVELFKSRELFKIMKTIGFSMVVKSFRAYSNLISAPLHEAFRELHDTVVVQKLTMNKDTIAKFLDIHPIIRKLSGVALAGLLLYLWLNMTFVGAIGFDMDLSNIADAFRGSYTVEDFLTSPDLVKYATLFITGTITGLSCSWLGSSIYNLVLAVVYTVGKKKKPELSALVAKKIKFGKS